MQDILLYFTVLVVFASLFINGWTDSGNSMATIVMTRVISPKVAVPLNAIFNMTGAFFGAAVAKTVLDGIVAKEVLTLHTMSAGITSVVVWGYLAAMFGWPISKSHALLAGIAGAGFAGGVILAYEANHFAPYLDLFWAGWGALLPGGWKKILYGLPLSLLVGFGGAWVLGMLVMFTIGRMHPSRSGKPTSVLHFVGFWLAGHGHGSNDTQKSIATLALVLYTGGVLAATDTIPWWLTVSCALTMGLGTACGGWRIVATLGRKMGPLVNWQGAAAMLNASFIVNIASKLGIPLSTTHTTAASIAGAIGSRRFSDIRLTVVIKIVKGWLITFLFCFALSAASALLVHAVF